MSKGYLKNYDEVREAVLFNFYFKDLRSLGQNIKPVRKTKRLVTMLCPFYQEKTASMTWLQHRNHFHCFGCGRGKDPIRFFADLEGISYIRALERLAKFYKIKMRWEKK